MFWRIMEAYGAWIDRSSDHFGSCVWCLIWSITVIVMVPAIAAGLIAELV